MWYPLKKCIVRLKNLRDESGQDLIEYGLAAALIGFGAVVGMESLANALNNVFITITSTIDTYVAP